jgi:hypothetical protein
MTFLAAKALQNELAQANGRLQQIDYEIKDLELMVTQAKFQVAYREGKLADARSRRDAQQHVRDQTAHQLEKFIEASNPANGSVTSVLQRQAIERVSTESSAP